MKFILILFSLLGFGQDQFSIDQYLRETKEIFESDQDFLKFLSSEPDQKYFEILAESILDGDIALSEFLTRDLSNKKSHLYRMSAHIFDLIKSNPDKLKRIQLNLFNLKNSSSSLSLSISRRTTSCASSIALSTALWGYFDYLKEMSIHTNYLEDEYKVNNSALIGRILVYPIAFLGLISPVVNCVTNVWDSPKTLSSFIKKLKGEIRKAEFSTELYKFLQFDSINPYMRNPHESYLKDKKRFILMTKKKGMELNFLKLFAGQLTGNNYVNKIDQLDDGKKFKSKQMRKLQNIYKDIKKKGLTKEFKKYLTDLDNEEIKSFLNVLKEEDLDKNFKNISSEKWNSNVIRVMQNYAGYVDESNLNEEIKKSLRNIDTLMKKYPSSKQARGIDFFFNQWNRKNVMIGNVCKLSATYFIGMSGLNIRKKLDQNHDKIESYSFKDIYIGDGFSSYIQASMGALMAFSCAFHLYEVSAVYRKIFTSHKELFKRFDSRTQKYFGEIRYMDDYQPSSKTSFFQAYLNKLNKSDLIFLNVPYWDNYKKGIIEISTFIPMGKERAKYPQLDTLPSLESLIKNQHGIAGTGFKCMDFFAPFIDTKK